MFRLKKIGMCADRPSKRNDLIGDLVALLQDGIEGLGSDDTVTVPVPLLRAVIKALERTPRPRGNRTREIRGRAKVQERLVLALLRGRKQTLVAQGLSAVEAELKVAEEDGPRLVERLTGRVLSADTIRRRLLQTAPRSRSRASTDAK